MTERHKRKVARKMLHKMGYKAGGHLHSPSDEKEDKQMIEKAISEHEEHDHPGQKKTRLKLRDGGYAHGGEPRARADRKSRGGKKGHTTVNIAIGHPHPQPVPVPVPSGGPAGGPPMPPPPGMGGGMPPGLAGAGGPPPIGQKNGGRSGYNKGGSVKTVKGYEAGSGGGIGRLEKAEKYGAKTGAREKAPAIKRT